MRKLNSIQREFLKYCRFNQHELGIDSVLYLNALKTVLNRGEYDDKDNTPFGKKRLCNDLVSLYEDNFWDFKTCER